MLLYIYVYKCTCFTVPYNYGYLDLYFMFITLRSCYEAQLVYNVQIELCYDVKLFIWNRITGMIVSTFGPQVELIRELVILLHDT